MPKKRTAPELKKTKMARPPATKAAPEKPKNASSREATGRKEVLRRMLLKNKHDIERDLGTHLGQQLHEEQGDRTDDVLDIGDQAAKDTSVELGLSFLEMKNKNLKAIHEALDRLNGGTYGFCAECGAEIPEKRLMAMPFATLCIDCQSRQETLEKIEKEEERFK